MSETLPPATVLKGDGMKGGPPGAGDVKFKRRVSNYLLNKRLQLRYVLLVTVLSAIISGSLGYMIYQQEHRASEDLFALADVSVGSEVVSELEAEIRDRDNLLVFKMGAAGVGLVLVLSLYLVIMTHKVAGPLFKVSLYFEKMAHGRLGQVTPLRKGDMLIDFFTNFREMHESVRTRFGTDVEAMERLISAARAAGIDQGPFAAEVARLAKHVEDRRDALR